MSHLIPESTYYARHFNLPHFDEQTQRKLRDARVLIIGIGGLGCPAALYLAGAGVGTLGLCDADNVSATNLHRQVLFDTSCTGQKKVDVAAARLHALNPHISVETIPRFADFDFLTEVLSRYDLVLDATDNFAAKCAIDDACRAARVPLVYGSIYQFEGQVSVFHHPTQEQTEGFSYRDIYPEAPPPGLTQNCGEAGVIGVLPGIVGTMQANEAIKVITGLGESLSGHLLTFDALTAVSRRLTLIKGMRSTAKAIQNEEITYRELQERLASGIPPILIDVRDLHEREAISLGGEHIPLNTLPNHLGTLPTHGVIVLYCKSGVRSAKAALYLRNVLPKATVFSLRGGVDACEGTYTVCAA